MRTKAITAVLLATGALVASPAAGHADPTANVTIEVTVTSANYAATVTVTSDLAGETFDINIVRVNAGVHTAGCTGATVCQIGGAASGGGVATFAVQAIGGRRRLFDTALNSYALIVVCTSPASCLSSPTLVALGAP
jgi:hypothetical protein